jgi:hypothetical protein
MSKINYMKGLKEEAEWLEKEEDDLRSLAEAMMDCAAEDRANAMGFYEAAAAIIKAADAIVVQYKRKQQAYIDACDKPHADFENA